MLLLVKRGVRLWDSDIMLLLEMSDLPDGYEIKDSPIHGKGVFSIFDVSAGTLIGVWNGIKYKNKAAYEAVYGKDFKYTYYSAFPWNPVWSCRENRNFISYINHSENNNVYLKNRKLYAYRDITAGTELTLKYPNKNFF